MLDRDTLKAHLDAQTFKLRPSDYALRYPKWPGLIGLEIEMLPVRAGEPPRSVRLQGGDDTIAGVLRTLSVANGWDMATTEGEGGQPLLLTVKTKDGDLLSFEPGGQLEFSSKPYPCLSEASRQMRDTQAILDGALAAQGISLVQVGINPWHTVPELGLQMTKGRYRAMDKYFASIGEYGQRMMRQTCTVQVNLDFGAAEDTLARRYLAGLLLAPVAAATFANSPVVDRKYAGIAGFRSRVWRYVDPSRTGLPGLRRLGAALSREACIDTYLAFALGARVVFVEALDYKVPERPITFGEWLTTPIDGVSPTLKDFETHLTLMFSEVRPRGFLELRSIDCQPRAWQTVPAAYWSGLLYDPKALDRLIELLLPSLEQADPRLVRAEKGLADPELAKLATEVMAIAEDGFARLPECFKAEGSAKQLQTFRAHFTARGRTPADDVVDRMKKDDAPYISLSALQQLEERWGSLT